MRMLKEEPGTGGLNLKWSSDSGLKYVKGLFPKGDRLFFYPDKF